MQFFFSFTSISSSYFLFGFINQKKIKRTITIGRPMIMILRSSLFNYCHATLFWVISLISIFSDPTSRSLPACSTWFYLIFNFPLPTFSQILLKSISWENFPSFLGQIKLKWPYLRKYTTLNLKIVPFLTFWPFGLGQIVQKQATWETPDPKVYTLTPPTVTIK